MGNQQHVASHRLLRCGMISAAIHLERDVTCFSRPCYPHHAGLAAPCLATRQLTTTPCPLSPPPPSPMPPVPPSPSPPVPPPSPPSPQPPSPPTPSPSPQPPSPPTPPPSPPPSPPAVTVRSSAFPACGTSTPCPRDGRVYHWCLSGKAVNGCGVAPFPAVDCSAQCLTVAGP